MTVVIIACAHSSIAVYVKSVVIIKISWASMLCCRSYTGIHTLYTLQEVIFVSVM